MRSKIVLFTVCALALLALPLVAQEFGSGWVRIMAIALLYVLLALGLNIVVGYAGLLDLGFVAFYAVGAYMYALLASPHLFENFPWVAELLPNGLHTPIWMVIPLAAGLAAIAGVLLGTPVLKLRGDYLAIVTLGFGEIIRVLILNIEAVGGARGLPGIPHWSDFFWVFLGVAVVIALSRNLAHSTHGRALFAIRDDEIAAEALGVDTTRYKVMAFVLGAFFAGVAGGLFAHDQTYLNPSTFTFIKSIEVIAMVVLGGLGSISGSILAAVVLTLLPEVLRPVKDYRMVIYALMLIVLMIARPQGLMGAREIDLSRWLRPLRRKTA
jgi:branched-chain amino acid transport system permease protein